MAASSRRSSSALLSLGILCCPYHASGQSPLAEGENPVVEMYMYRAMAYNNVSGVPYANANVNMGDLQGVTQYVHREVITDHQIQDAVTRTHRKYDISHILRWRFLVKNPTGMPELDEFVTFDYGQATNPVHWDRFQEFGDFVGHQVQADTFVKFTDPYYWFSVSGDCPSLPFRTGIETSMCSLDDPCPSKTFAEDGCLPNGFRPGSGQSPHHCPCTSDGERVAGGLCNPGQTGGPPEEIVVPTGEHGCVYSYDPRPEVVSWDDIAGITAQRCAHDDVEEPCRDWSDFRVNCVSDEYKRTFTSEGEIETVAYCVEYDLHPDCMDAPDGSTEDQQGCNNAACRAMSDGEREIGLPFWQGRCTDTANSNRAELLAEAFGVEGATTSHHISPPHSAEYADVECKHIGKCFGNPVNGESFCTRAWGGVCTDCRIPGPRSPSANRAHSFCPWNLIETSDYGEALASVDHCRNKSPQNFCCLYSNTCDAPYNDIHNPPMDHFRNGELNENTAPDMIAFAMAVRARTHDDSHAEILEDLMLRLATELLEIPRANGPGLGAFSYWSWGLAPSKEWVSEQWDEGMGNVASLNYNLLLEELGAALPLPPTTPPTVLAPAPQEQPVEQPSSSMTMTPIYIAMLVLVALAVAAVVGGWLSGENRLDGNDPKASALTVEMGGVAESSS